MGAPSGDRPGVAPGGAETEQQTDDFENHSAPGEGPHAHGEQRAERRRAWRATRTWFSTLRATMPSAREQVTLDDLRRMIVEPKSARGRAKNSFRLFSLAAFRGPRSRANVHEIGALILDDDSAHLVLERVVADLRTLGWLAFVCTTYSTDDEAPTYRLIVPLARPVTADEYDRLHALVRSRLAALGHEIPPGAIDASRAWYEPVDRQEPGRTYRHAEVDGDLLDPDAVMGEAENAWAAHRKRAGDDEQRETNARTASGRPGDDWAAVTPWSDILTSPGWTFAYQRGDVGHWVRPGKSVCDGISATTNHSGKDTLYVFSDAAPPFEPHQSYTKFAAFALLNHGGDFKAAAAELARRGFGSAEGASGSQRAGGTEESKAADGGDDGGAYLSAVAREKVVWLWWRRIARRKLHLLYGDPEMLKTTLAMTLAALLSRNKPLPGSTTPLPDGPLATIFFTWEDGRADTLVGRAIAAGADLRLIRVYEEKLPSIPDDLDVIERAVKRVEHETGVKVGLIVIDPLAAALGGKVDSHNNSSSRRALSPLKILAQRLEVAILLIDHTNKTVGQKAIHRISGSAAFIAAVRIGLLAGWDPDDTEQDPNKRRRALARAKGNIGARPPALLYLPREVLMDETGADPDDTEVAIDFTGESTVTADAMVAPPETEQQRREVSDENADDLLIAELATRPRPVRAIEVMAKEAGITKKALDRARRELGVVSKRRASDGVWFWSLRDSTLRCTEEEVAETSKASERARSTMAAAEVAPEKLVAYVTESDQAGKVVSKEDATDFVTGCGVPRGRARSLVGWERQRWHLEKAARRGGGWRVVLGPEPSPGDDRGEGETKSAKPPPPTRRWRSRRRSRPIARDPRRARGFRRRRAPKQVRRVAPRGCNRPGRERGELEFADLRP